MIHEPPTSEPFDWTEAVDSYHRGELLLDELAEYTCDPGLTSAEVAHLAHVIAVGQCLERPRSCPASGPLAGSTRSDPGAIRYRDLDLDDPDDVCTIALDGPALAAHEHIARTRHAAHNDSPSAAVKDLFNLDGARFGPRRLNRYLTDDWFMVVSVVPGDDLAGVACGEDEMDSVDGCFELKIGRDANTVLDKATEPLTFRFSDGSIATAYIY